MCLGVPGRVVSVDGWVAVVDFWGVQRKVALQIVDEPVAPGDYILNHVGFAIRRIPPSDVEATLALYEAILADAAGPMAEEVRDELREAGDDGG